MKQVQFDVRAISSGTLGLLIGSPLYRDIDPIAIEFALFTDATIAEANYQNWHQAWIAFSKCKGKELQDGLKSLVWKVE
ncbi:MAG: hypothetical protein HXX08_11205 [Chloroflexi bacterium]|uniref:Uncharacterized protein n=1 Tax=Candidatus Chlorohelix allophototropha TaxID=3003348 RepID=A0A8T7M3D3_9CHLR|nr:hypothetical protein [Chloroflexota bacterium]WJW65804.1 hypothetical protein OZ401_001583 [Chloroflexota bacterium L227-S17]